MENPVQIDSGIIFDFFVGGENSGETQILLRDSRAILSAVTIYELFAGVKNERHLQQREALIYLCEVIDLDTSIMRKAAGIYIYLQDRGELIPNEDIIIAACSLLKGCPLFTLNRKHFERIPELQIYPVHSS